MYEYLKGGVLETGEQTLVLECAGVGYLLHATPGTISELAAADQPVTAFTHLVHREDAMELYGFSSREERLVFRQLLSLSGIGPRQALKFLSGMPVGRFVAAVLAGDIAVLTTIPGLGQKRAEKIAFELKEKLQGLPVLAAAEGAPRDESCPADAVLALEALGFSTLLARSAVRKALAETGDPADIQAVIRAALRHV